jgi:hypothetical protein
MADDIARYLGAATPAGPHQGQGKKRDRPPATWQTDVTRRGTKEMACCFHNCWYVKPGA